MSSKDVADDYTRRLKDVFDLCDIDKRGYISIDHFVQLANQHFGTSGWDSDNQEVCLFYEVILITDNYRQFTDHCRQVNLQTTDAKF